MTNATDVTNATPHPTRTCPTLQHDRASTVQHNRASIFSHGDVCTTPRSRGRAVALASFLSLRAAELTADMSDVLSAATSVQSFGGPKC